MRQPDQNPLTSYTRSLSHSQEGLLPSVVGDWLNKLGYPCGFQMSTKEVDDPEEV